MVSNEPINLVFARMQDQHTREIRIIEQHVKSLNDYIEVQARVIDKMEVELKLLREIHGTKAI